MGVSKTINSPTRTTFENRTTGPLKGNHRGPTAAREHSLPVSRQENLHRMG